jgi:hypothetical protein
MRFGALAATRFRSQASKTPAALAPPPLPFHLIAACSTRRALLDEEGKRNALIEPSLSLALLKRKRDAQAPLAVR